MAFETRDDDAVAEATGVRRADVVFVLDTTGSMAEVIGAVKDSINKVAEVYLESNILIRLSLIEFRDRVEAASKGNHEFENRVDGPNLPTLRVARFKTDENSSTSTFTRDFDAFKAAVSELVADGGGPLEESSLDALAIASMSEWKEGATRILILLTDAPPHIPDYEMKSATHTASKLTEQGIDQMFVLCPSREIDEYRELARARTTRGTPIYWQFLPLEQTSSDIIDSLLQVATSSSTSISGSELEEEEVPSVVFNDDDDEDLDGNPFL